ncbi:MAG: hypothetical protein ACRDRO_06360 [Pseudonocardiaceae bacterium]
MNDSTTLALNAATAAQRQPADTSGHLLAAIAATATLAASNHLTCSQR